MKVVSVFAGIIAKFRKSRGISQSQFAKEVNVSIHSIQLYEQKQTDIDKAQHNHLKLSTLGIRCINT